jgi:ligand-binding sensor domain-containing protein
MGIAWGQTPGFRQHPLKDLGTASVSVLLQDGQGWIWCGTAAGLYRYDGLNFQAVLLPDSCAASTVTALHEAGGQVWAGFQNGQIAHLPIGDAFLQSFRGGDASFGAQALRMQAWQPEEGLPRRPITAFASDPEGGLWFGTYGEGLYAWKFGRLFQFSAADDGLGSDELYDLEADAQGRIWAATDAGISICSMAALGQKSVRVLGRAEGLPDEIVQKLLCDPQGNMWIGTHDKGLCCYDAAALRCKRSSANWPYGPVRSMAVYGGRELWVGTEDEGLLLLRSADLQPQPLPEGHPLRKTGIPALLKDREGLLWLASERQGLYSANVPFAEIPGAPANAQATCSDSQGRLWVGNESGLFVLENARWRKLPSKVPNVIALWAAPQGEIWAGTFGEGVFVFDAAGRLLTHLDESDGLANGSILSVGGHAGKVWLATLGGVNTVERGTGWQQPRIGKQPELGTSYVYKVFSDGRGRVLFGTDGRGLGILEGGALRFWSHSGSTPIKTVYSIVEDGAGRIWFSADQNGLFCLGPGDSLRHFDRRNHLHSNNIIGLACDGNGHLVLCYEDGFDLMNPARSDHVVFCDTEMGAPAAAVNLNAACTDADGDVWIGTRQGVLRVAAYREPFVDDPQPRITAVSVLTQDSLASAERRFAHDQNYLVFNFIGLWYTDPEAVRYRYRLDGFDPAWKVSKDHLASYPNLPPGRYTFRLQASEHGDFANVPESSWSFEIAPPFWATWWFALGMGLLLWGILYAFVRWRERRLRREAKLRRERVESQFAVLKSQINPHFLFNSFNTLITIIEESPRVAVDYVEHLSDFYRSILQYREQDFISLGEEAGLVDNFCYLLTKRYEQGFLLDNRIPPNHAAQIMPLTLQILVENAVKHNVISKAKPLRVEISLLPEGYVQVRNNLQPKIRPEPGTHFGLQSLLRRYELLGEKPVLVDNDGHFFRVRVPLRAPSETKHNMLTINF